MVVGLQTSHKEGIIKVHEYEEFFKSIHTVAKEFTDDFSMVSKKQLSKAQTQARRSCLA